MSELMAVPAIYAKAHLDHGIELFRNNRFQEAVVAFDAALHYDPGNTYARYNRSTALLSMGDYARGFQEYEVAWRLFHWRGFGPIGPELDRIEKLPLWRGEHGARVLVYHEMGFGDAIMAMRFLHELRRHADITLVIDPCLMRLARLFDIEVVTKVPDDLDEFEARLPLFAVMAALLHNEATIPAEPYIIADSPARESQTGKIGIAWSGRTQTAFSLDRFLELLAHGGFTLHALQPGALAREDVEELPPGSDFLDVAERIAEMNHIVCVDTAAVHLAGAMGHPSAHLVLPFLSDWRWHRSKLWYPQLKTYRQDHAADWTTPFARLNAALRSPQWPTP